MHMLWHVKIVGFHAQRGQRPVSNKRLAVDIQSPIHPPPRARNILKVVPKSDIYHFSCLRDIPQHARPLPRPDHPIRLVVVNLLRHHHTPRGCAEVPHQHIEPLAFGVGQLVQRRGLGLLLHRLQIR
ncbi:hypothetical protein H257_15659 [Aphanomyces astaci]|uniref:Uncharacterized protein n=1 Tax=Aphanomyces astaci TaxID=112090 RepID=W4FN31_APHAT|nr:hypothetical protein H257_15659 [Aphanomyces astaci]ETV68336.1 hypothetical protein H257_15659 [Aphanomyces astaci]|eukprot:XP_009842131.1 hypothetical protein H257_15659 [Aphanomyces astaci]